MRARRRTVSSRREPSAARSFWAEAIAVILTTVALLLLVSLASYHADDPVPWFSGDRTNEPVQNVIGPAGALCAEFLLQLFGYAAWMVPPILLLLSWEVFWRRSGRALSRFAGSALLVLSAAASLNLVIDERTGTWARDAGGWFGYAFAHLLARPLNRWGALIAALAVVIISLLVVTRSSMVDALRLIWTRSAALTRNVWLAWVRHREARRKEQLRLEVGRRQRERRAAAAAAGPEESEPAVEPHAAAPIPMAATDVEASPPAEARAAAAAARRASRASARAKGGPAEGQPQFDFGETPPRYTPPPLSLLNPPQHEVQVDEKELVETARIITEKCREFDVTGQVIAIQPGPVVTVFEFKPDPGVKYSKIVTLADDLCLAIEAESIRIDRIAGKSTVGIEVPNKKRETISLRELLASERFQKATAPLTIALGKEINGEPYYADLARMPHLLVAGSTGSGKSVCLNTILTSFLYKSSPEEVKFIMIDPKRLELGVYENIPHLLTPLVTETKKASNSLRWAVLEMERRYKQLAEAGVRGIDQYNLIVKRDIQERAAAAGAQAPGSSATGAGDAQGAAVEPAAGESPAPASARVPVGAGETIRPLPYIVIVVDELADLMMTTGAEVEEAITRLAQMARAVGIHLILSTQRPSVDIITGVIKANFPCRVAMRVSSKVDSRTILDSNGAEQLLGQGDMLFIPPGSARLIRLHGPLVTEVEATRIVTFLKKQAKPQYDESVTRDGPQTAAGGAPGRDEEVDPAYEQAVRLAIQMGQISVSHIQRRLKLGYARAARLVDMMEQNGIVGPADGSKPREVLVEPEFLERMDQMRAERT